METGILTSKKLFMKDVHYIIPPFQRPYVWSQDDQWEPLWEDICNVAEGYLEKMERCGDDAIAAQQTDPHFLGAVVIKQIRTATKDIEQREVIDGQQRVTTLQLLLDAIRQICEESGQTHFKKTAYRLAKFVTNDRELIGDDEHHVFKLWPTRSDREAFRHVMDSGPAANNVKESLIVQAHEFFRLQIRNWLYRAEPVEPRVDALEAATTSLLQMVVIDLDPQDDPNLIFETLNARGTPLEQSDLIKNFVLSEKQDPQIDIWGNLDDGWWRKEIRQGRLLRPRLDILLNYWLSMRMGSEVSPSRVFDEFGKYTNGSTLGKVMSSVKQDLANYRDFEMTKGRNDEEKSFYRHVNVMQARVITPVLLLLLPVEKETRIRAFSAIESFLVRRMICRHTTKDYNKVVLELAGHLQKGGLDKADTITAGFLKEQTAYSRKWPSNEDVTEAFEKFPLYRLLTRGRLRLILESVESQLRSSGKAEQSVVPMNLTIEHLMPIGWNRDGWPLPAGVAADTAIYERNMLIHSIGNLTLVSNKLNSSMSNDIWIRKREELQRHSVLLLNRELLQQPSWNEDTIRSRSRRMAEIVSTRWPGPDSKVWSEIS